MWISWTAEGDPKPPHALGLIRLDFETLGNGVDGHVVLDAAAPLRSWIARRKERWSAIGVTLAHAANVHLRPREGLQGP
jgi:hypothetical protein